METEQERRRRKMKKNILAVLITLGFSLSIPAFSIATEVRGIDVVEFGIFKLDKVGERESKNTTSGSFNVTKEERLIKGTDKVVATVGTHFGFRFKLNGLPEGQKVLLQGRVLHPQISNPETQKMSIIDSWEIEETIGHTNYIGWSFDHDWEIVPGKWTIQLFYGSKKLAEKIFKVRRENQAGTPAPADETGYVLHFRNGRKLICDRIWREENTVFVVVKGKSIALGYDEKRINLAKTFKMN